MDRGIYDTSPSSNIASEDWDNGGDNLVMGRTIPSFRMALGMEQEDWKPFRNALDKSDRKKFDDMWDIPRLYTSACSYAPNPVRLYPILMSILLHHFKELTECIKEVERIEAKVIHSNNPVNKKAEDLARNEEGIQPQRQEKAETKEMPITLDRFLNEEMIFFESPIYDYSTSEFNRYILRNCRIILYNRCGQKDSES